MSSKSHNTNIIRFALLVVVFLILGAVLRWALVPHSFGEYGPYRGHAVEETMSQETIYMGMASCKTCHPKVIENMFSGSHNNHKCEACHYAKSKHAKGGERNPVKLADMAVDTSQDECRFCHLKVPGRPNIRQLLSFEGHLKKLEAEPGSECITCHDPHNPAM